MTALTPRVLRRLSVPRRRRAVRRAMRGLGYGKVFGIGAARTGTSSLGRALVLLGFRHTSWDPELWRTFERGDYEPIYEVADRFESFEDGPWNGGDLYRRLDERYPGSKFVLTVRDPLSWLESHERHFSAAGATQIPERYLVENYDERRDEILQAYQARNEAIRTHFASRPDDLLLLDVVAGDGWERLCPFLGLDVPDEPFPHLNASRGGGH